LDTIKKRHEEATSKETLEDLDDSAVEGDSADETDGPSPDGAFDDEEDLKHADPV
jgi:hypothetical protein